MKYQIQSPRISNNEIDQLGDRLYDLYKLRAGKQLVLAGINFDLLYKHVIFPEYGIRIEEGCNLTRSENGDCELGKFNSLKNTAYIDDLISEISKDKRRAFTLYHEVCGHGILHGPHIRGEVKRLMTESNSRTPEIMIDPDEIYIFERQANRLASCLAAPMELVIQKLFLHFRLSPSRPTIRYIGPGKYSLDSAGHLIRCDVKSYSDFCWKIARQIDTYFGGLSTESLSYRVARSPFVENATSNAYIDHYKEWDGIDLDLSRIAV